MWRPLVVPLHDRPLAVCDYRSTDPADYVSCDVPSPEYIGESYLLHHNPKHDWWFLKEMYEDEVFVIKMYDSQAERAGGQSLAKCKIGPPRFLRPLPKYSSFPSRLSEMDLCMRSMSSSADLTRFTR